MRELRFGDVVEWGAGPDVARWFIIDPAPNTQTGVWLAERRRYYSPGQISKISANWGKADTDTRLLTEKEE